MAATAYASLVSLLNTLDQSQTHPRLSTYFDNFQFESLRKIVDFLVDFMENYSEEAEDLMRPIADAAHKAEGIIEAEAADRIRGESTTKSLTMLLRMEKLIQDMSSIKEKVINFKEETGFINSMPPPSSSTLSSSAPPATKKSTMLGFDRYVEKLLDELTGHDSRRRILPIVGMGGVGKTTLARNVYENSLVVYHFDVRAWVTVSQEYNETNMLLQALSCLGGSKNKTDDRLDEELHKTLSGRRYLIVLDDVWSVVAWEKIKSFLPENGNGSRIVVTTRQQELVDYFGSSSLAVGFLDYENSWDLFCAVTFAEQHCPPHLQRIAKTIVRKCKGLPLATRVIGGLLGKSPRTQEYWEKILKDKSLVMEYSGEGNKPSNILYMSYKHLPVWLKSCFLYLGLFPEDHLIDVSCLIKLWVAEGFIKPIENQSLEQVAEGYIKELVDRNLLLVGKLTEYKKVISYCLHDLVRELCINTAERENFYWVRRDIVGGHQYIFDERAAIFYPRESVSFSEKLSVVKPLIFSGYQEAPIKSRLLRVLFDYDYSKSWLETSFQQANLPHYGPYNLAIPLSLCWGLQTLIMEGRYRVPSEIWKMPQLRHIEIESMELPDPPLGDVFVLHNLQTLKRVSNLKSTEDVCTRTPNIRELEIDYDYFGWRKVVDWGKLRHLNNLESLRFTCHPPVYDLFDNLKLPNSLRELTLENCCIAWSGMTMIASLPHLQLLQLKEQAVRGAKWNFVKEDFRSLKHLHISSCEDLINWTAEKSNFPVLETLHLQYLRKLDEIPQGIGDIPTLEKIYVSGCTESASMSAIKILEEQENLGNQDLQLEIHVGPSDWEKIKERYTSQNLHIFNWSAEAEDLMRRIGDAVHEAEGIIEVEAADRIRGGSTRKKS